MIIFKTVQSLRAHIAGRPDYNSSSGFVPTMGALHKGHLALIEKCKKERAFTVASIFVNPTQFNVVSDFQKYPVTLATDIQMLESAGCDILFLPSVEEIYPEGTGSSYTYDLGKLETTLEGFYRPGHFQGVCQVVHRLLDIVQPVHMYLGQKDFQQCMVIKRMIETLHMPVELHTVPTVREVGGLAMSSRNMRLDEQEKLVARSIYKQLQTINDLKDSVPPAVLKQNAVQNLLEDGFTKVDYVEIAAPSSLEPLVQLQKGMEAVALIAAYINEVRLIDNMILH